MTDPTQAVLTPLPESAELTRIVPARAEINQAFYLAVGEPWGWTDKADWTANQWRAYVQGHGHALAATPVESIHTWVLQDKGEDAGYFELARSGTEAEVRYFGLLPSAIGRGLGAGLLSCAVAQAWALGVERVWVHTCTLDHPVALANYKKRGFQLYHTETEPV
ncbi:GNAT family N-acetyltransferase [Simiduia agarivorans]|nr:GNAT family N-acetyltransferase [Simiduia agarivorans]